MNQVEKIDRLKRAVKLLLGTDDVVKLKQEQLEIMFLRGPFDVSSDHPRLIAIELAIPVLEDRPANSEAFREITNRQRNSAVFHHLCELMINVVKDSQFDCSMLVDAVHVAALETGSALTATGDDYDVGLYGKYIVLRRDGSSMRGQKHDHCEYFVLDWNHDKFALPAMAEYARCCENEYPKLAADIRAKIAVVVAENDRNCSFKNNQPFKTHLLNDEIPRNEPISYSVPLRKFCKECLPDAFCKDYPDGDHELDVIENAINTGECYLMKRFFPGSGTTTRIIGTVIWLIATSRRDKIAVFGGMAETIKEAVKEEFVRLKCHPEPKFDIICNKKIPVGQEREGRWRDWIFIGDPARELESEHSCFIAIEKK